MSEESAVTTEEAVVETTTTETATEASEKAFVDTFRDSITDEGLKGEKMWKELEGKSADEVGKYMRELKAFSGKKGDIPKPDAPDEEWDAFRQKLGRPESIDGYDFGLSEEFKNVVGEQSGFSDEALGWFKETAFKLGATAEQAEDLMNDYLNLVIGQHDRVGKITEERMAEQDVALKNEWGDYREGIETGIKAMLKDKGGLDEEGLSALVDAGLLKDPSIAVPLAKIAAKFESDPELGEFIAESSAGLQEQMMELQTEMQREINEFGKPRAETKQKWMRVRDKVLS